MRDVRAMQLRLTHANDEWRIGAADVAASGQPD
jgi:hypothetical protein